MPITKKDISSANDVSFLTILQYDSDDLKNNFLKKQIPGRQFSTKNFLFKMATLQ
jgi:hypothetical protein